MCKCNHVDNVYRVRDPSEDDPISPVVENIYLNTPHIWPERNIWRVYEIWNISV